MSLKVKQIMRSLLLLGGSLCDDNLLDDGGLVQLGDWQSLAVLGELVEHVSALSACVSIGVICHVGGFKGL